MFCLNNLTHLAIALSATCALSAHATVVTYGDFSNTSGLTVVGAAAAVTRHQQLVKGTPAFELVSPQPSSSLHEWLVCNTSKSLNRGGIPDQSHRAVRAMDA